MKTPVLLNTIFVVEGKNDRERLRKLDIPYVVITDGTNVSRETLNHLQTLEKKHNIVILTDPDNAGKKISAKLQASLNAPIIIDVTKRDAILKKDIGIEHIPLGRLQEIVTPYVQNTYVSSSNIALLDLIDLGLTGQRSKPLRTKLANNLSLIYGPLKTMYIQLLLLDITREMIEEILDE